MRVGALIMLPVHVLWAVIKGCAAPAVITTFAWWWLPDNWARWTTIVMAIWAGIVILLIAAKVRGYVRGVTRGPFYLSSLDDVWL